MSNARLEAHWGLAAAVVALTLTLVVPMRALAHDPYTDRDSNYLKVIDYFAYPVGVLLEWTIARPLHALETRGVAGQRAGRYTQVGTLRVKRGCRSARPPRYCTGKRYR